MEVRSRLIETHAFLKVDAGATLKMTITAMTLESIDENIFDPNEIECGSTTARNCTWVTHGEITGNFYAGTPNRKLDEVDFTVFLRGWRDHWESGAEATTEVIEGGHPTAEPRVDVLADSDFEFDDDVTGGGTGAFARVKLTRPAKIESPIDTVAVGDIVFLKVDVTSSALNRRDGEVFVSAHFRDPLELEGTSLDFTGLQPIPVPDAFPRFPQLTPEEAPPCSTASDPEAGTLQFGQAELSAPRDSRASRWSPSPAWAVPKASCRRSSRHRTERPSPGSTTDRWTPSSVSGTASPALSSSRFRCSTT